MAATKTPAKPTDREQKMADLLAEFIACYQGQPGRAQQVADELAAMLPDATIAE